MKNRNFSSQIATCLLGFLNGLIFGVVAETTRSLFVQWIWEEYERPRLLKVLDGAYPSSLMNLPDTTTPILCAIVFAAASHLIDRYWIHRSSSYLLFWQIVGVIAVTIVVPLHTVTSNNSGDDLLNPLAKWIVALALVLPINLSYGIAVKKLSELFLTTRAPS